MAVGPDNSNIEVNCNMAQAFEIPTGKPDSDPDDVPAALSRPSLPGGPIRQLNR
jgi:hypothetical protein